jgi:micrococcal nuclease
VVDGDTVRLDFGTATESVRLLGVDAPESVHPTLPQQCFGPEASRRLAALLPPGTTVSPRRDTEPRDRYGRLLLHLFRVEDDLHVNRWLVTEGLADTVSYPPNTAYRAELTRARGRAEADGLGLWGRCDGPDQPLDPVPPTG